MDQSLDNHHSHQEIPVGIEVDVDVYDLLPPEIIDLILQHLDHPTLFSCSTLSKRWARRVVPQLWDSPYMVYYVSWMKLLKTLTTGNKSPKNGSPRKLKSSSKSASPVLKSFSSSSPQQSSSGSIGEVAVCDSYGRLGASFSNLVISGATTVHGFISDNVTSNSGKQEGKDDENEEEDEGDDDDDDDPSGLLRLAESQRQDKVQVGWGGNCTPDRGVSSTKEFKLHAREKFSPTTSNCSSTVSSPRSDFSGSVSSRSSNSSLELTDDIDKDVQKVGLGMEIFTTTINNGNNVSDINSVSLTTDHVLPCIDKKEVNTTDISPQKQQQQTLSTAITLGPLKTEAPSPPFVFPYGSCIRVLNFSRLYYIVSDKFLTLLLPQTPSLLELYINSPKQFSDVSLESLANSCPRVRLLEFIGCTKITDNGFNHILESCHDLQSLTLSNNGPARITDKTISQLAMSPINLKSTSSSSFSSAFTFSSSSCSSRGQRLRVLNLSCASNSITGQHPGLLSIAIWCTNLISLDLSHCRHDVNDEFLRILSTGGSKVPLDSDNHPIPSTSTYDDSLRPRSTLRYLCLAHCIEITDKGLIFLARGCPELRILDITALCLVTDESIIEICKNCPSFQRLVMDEKYGSRITRKLLDNLPWGPNVVQNVSNNNSHYNHSCNVRRGSRTF